MQEDHAEEALVRKRAAPSPAKAPRTPPYHLREEDTLRSEGTMNLTSQISPEFTFSCGDAQSSE